MILAMFFGFLFLCLYLSQPTPTRDGLYGIRLLGLIRRGLVSRLDILTVNHYLWNDKQYYSTLQDGVDIYLSYRIYTSRNGRFYQYIYQWNFDGGGLRRSVKFISLSEALCLLREDTNTLPRVYYKNYKVEVFSLLNGKPSELYQLQRPRLAA